MATSIQELPKGLAAIFNEIDRAINARLYFLAFSSTLIVPEICAAAELDLATQNVRAEHYKTWCDKYLLVEQSMKLITSEDIYHLRGGIIHTGFFSHRHRKFTRVEILVPESWSFVHKVIVKASYDGGKTYNSILSLTLTELVLEMRTAAARWYAEKSGDAKVVENITKIVTVRNINIPLVSGTFVALG